MSNVVYINSLPKSGTHLLAKVLELIEYEHQPKRFIAADWVTNVSLTKTVVKRVLSGSLCARNDVSIGLDVSSYTSEQSIKNLLSEAKNLNRASYLLGHAPYSDLLHHILLSHEIKMLFIIRDPRDVLVSWANYIHQHPGHFAYSGHVGKNFEDRVQLVLKGGYLPNGIYIESFASILCAISGWLNAQNVFVTRFEDLVGSQGGGSDLVQSRELERICGYLGVDNINPTVIASQLFGGTKTFREGQIAGWQNALSVDLKKQVDEKILHLLPGLGYSAGHSS